MKHILKYRFLNMIRNRAILFWTFIFPILLMTLFGLVLRGSYMYTEFDTIPIVIVDNTAWQKDEALKTVMKEAKSGDEPLFKVSVKTEGEAEKLLKNDKIDAYVICGETYDLHVKTSGLNQTITQTFFDEYLQKSSMIQNMMMKGATMEQIQNMFTSTMDYVEENGNSSMDMTNVYFYTGLAMSAMFGGMWAITAINDIQADQTQKGARVSLAPISKATHLASSLLLNLVFVFATLVIQFAYIYFAFDVSFGTYTPYMFLLLMVGDIAGSGLGVLVGTFHTKDPDAKVGLLSSITMLGSFLAGMMVIQLKWIIYHFAPIINYINPVSMITDGLYSIYYYGIGERFFMNLISLLIFSAVCYVIAYISLSKKQYKAVGVK